MIVLNLTCAQGHVFEGWFPSSEAFEHQCHSGLIGCTVCGATEITRLPSSPRINKSHQSAVPLEPRPAQADELTKSVIAAAFKALTQLAENCDDVSERFPEEARKIHHGEAEPRNIKGKATLEETLELLDEGIPVLPLVTPPDEEKH